MSYIPQVGHRVRVTFDDEVVEVCAADDFRLKMFDWLVLDGLDVTVERLPDPESAS